MKVLRATSCILGAALAAVVVACGGGKDSPDPLAYVAGLAEQPPSTLAGAALSGDFESFADEDLGLIAAFQGFYDGAGLEYNVFVDVYRSEDTAAAGLAAWHEAYQDSIEVEGKPGTYCSNLDEADTRDSLCFGRYKSVYIEVDAYPSNEDLPAIAEVQSASLSMLSAVAGHLHSLEAAARAPIPPKALAALSAAVPPPPAPGDTEFSFPASVDDELLGIYDWARQYSWTAGDDWRLFLSTFDSASDARSFKNAYLGDNEVVEDKGSGATCLAAGDKQYWVCISLVEETAVFVEHKSTSEELDREAADLSKRAVDQVRELRAGKLPPERPAPSRSGRPVSPTSAPTPSPSPSPTPSPTPVPPPYVNGGTWTFDMKVTSNDCPSGEPAIGSDVTLEFEFSESGGDDAISNGELFYLEQYGPAYRDIGLYTMSIPHMSFEFPVTSGDSSGRGIVAMDFLAPDSANVSYVEDFGVCTLTAE